MARPMIKFRQETKPAAARATEEPTVFSALIEFERREVVMDAKLVAKWFANLDDDQQTQVIVAIAEEFENYSVLGASDAQLYAIGGHLRSCKCSTEAAREWVRKLAHYLEVSTHK